MESNQKNFKLCEVCKGQANSICYECFMYLCDSCYKIVHEKVVENNHKKEKIDYFLPIDTKCQNHPKIPINLFCIDDKGKL